MFQKVEVTIADWSNPPTTTLAQSVPMLGIKYGIPMLRHFHSCLNHQQTLVNLLLMALGKAMQNYTMYFAKVFNYILYIRDYYN